jgi:uncharacterized protein
MMHYVLAILVFVSGTSCHSSKENLLGNDYALFKETPVWELAQAVEEEDLEEIKKLVQEEKLDVNYPEPKYGNTLLMLTVLNQQYASCKTVLELGADPNQHNSYSGSSAIINAAEIQNYPTDTTFLKLLLSHGGNPNDEEVGPRKESNTTRLTPLLAACSGVMQNANPIEKVKLLVGAGANVNYKNEFSGFALKEALLHENYDVALYLLEKGADYNEMLFDRGAFSEGGKKIYIADFLREQFLSLDSEEYKQKMAIVAFLKERDIDYRKTPIPDYAKDEAKKMYPKNWKDYLEKY